MFVSCMHRTPRLALWLEEMMDQVKVGFAIVIDVVSSEVE